MAKHNEIGRIGEDIAARWLISKDFEILERNYLKKWGEIDIVARETGGKVHFIEVKSVSYETKADLDRSVSHETWRPEDNVHKHKQDRLSRAIQSWLTEHSYTADFQIDIVTVRMVPCEKIARVKYIDNVVFE